MKNIGKVATVLLILAVLMVAAAVAENGVETSAEEAQPVVATSQALDASCFEYIIENGGVTITGYHGPEDVDLVIPAYINGYPVRVIGGKAFYFRTDLSGRLILPDTLTTIGAWSFYFCEGLTGDLVIPDSITTIGAHAFAICSGLTGDLTIPNSVISIGNGAFKDCYGLTGKLTLSSRLTLIEAGTFLNDRFTGELVIPDSVTSIDWSAFEACYGLTGTLTIPQSVASIGRSAFKDCSGFTGELVIPDSITTIGDIAFANCRGLTGNLTIPESVVSIGEFAFANCYGLNGKLTLGSGLKSINPDAFQACNFTIYKALKETYAASWLQKNGFKPLLLVDDLDAPEVFDPTLKQESDGKFYYYGTNGLRDSTYSDPAFAFEGGKFIIVNGVMANDLHGVQNLNGVDFFFYANGQVQEVSQLALYNGTWFVVDQGKVNLSYTGLYDYNGGTFLITDGGLRSDYTGPWTDPVYGEVWIMNGQVQPKPTPEPTPEPTPTPPPATRRPGGVQVQ